MKKNLLYLITIASFSFANAQLKEKGTFEITPKIGHSSFTEYSNSSNSGSNSGVAFGATSDYYFNNRWSLRSGLVYNKMGGKTSDWNNILIEDKLDYLVVPINANWHFGSTRKWNLNFGVSPSFLLSAKTNDIEISKNDIESFQLGLTFGIGYKIEITKKFGILLDYQGFAGLTNIDKSSNLNYTNVGDTFSVGGVFEL